MEKQQIIEEFARNCLFELVGDIPQLETEFQKIIPDGHIEYDYNTKKTFFISDDITVFVDSNTE